MEGRGESKTEYKKLPQDLLDNIKLLIRDGYIDKEETVVDLLSEIKTKAQEKQNNPKPEIKTQPEDLLKQIKKIKRGDKKTRN